MRKGLFLAVIISFNFIALVSAAIIPLSNRGEVKSYLAAEARILFRDCDDPEIKKVIDHIAEQNLLLDAKYSEISQFMKIFLAMFDTYWEINKPPDTESDINKFISVEWRLLKFQQKVFLCQGGKRYFDIVKELVSEMWLKKKEIEQKGFDQNRVYDERLEKIITDTKTEGERTFIENALQIHAIFNFIEKSDPKNARKNQIEYLKKVHSTDPQ